ncbi:pyrimidine-nucleoside phosphorylase [Acholeplasma hippikon]|nr:pyrimidine-nucleoside phosphorylase [Acholeplasma hippikon]
MEIVDLINKKKYGGVLTNEEINFVIENYTNGNIPDYQMSAFLMAVYFQGMNSDESTALALAMRDSGEVVDLHDIHGVKVDKHSTGGVGDKVTLVLAPLVAYLGAKLAKMSGRGLGHTGGTIDKLESIPGFNVVLPLDQFKQQVNEIGCAVVGQSGDIAPADKKIYALRDVTATVDSIPLIASSIMSKKLASGADAIVLDVKVGSGAFMKTKEEAIELSRLMVQIGQKANKKVTAILTSMDEPLGHKIGNSLEVYEAIETLEGNGPEDLTEVVSVITGHLLAHAGVSKTSEEGYLLAKDTLKKGKALPNFYQLVEAQGGDVDFVKDKNNLLGHTKQFVITAEKDGYLETVDALNFGIAAMKLGAGRMKKDDKLDLYVGLDLHKKIGDEVKKGDAIVTLYHNEKGLKDAIKLISESYVIGNTKRTLKLIEETITE